MMVHNEQSMEPDDAVQSSKPSGGGSLTALRWLVVGAAIGMAVWFMASFVSVFTSDALVAPLELSLGADEVSSKFPTGASAAEATALVDVETGLGYRLMWWLVTDARSLLGLAFAAVMYKMLANDTQPFTEANAKRLKTLIGLSLGFACTDFLRPIVSVAIQDSAGFDGFEVSWDFTSIYLAVLLSGLLQIWQRGVSLQSEQELTI